MPLAAAADGAANAAGDDEEEDDWRLRGPAAKPRAAAFKPGTSTWDTDDAKEAARKVGKRALAEQAAAQQDRKKAKAGRVEPAAWWAEHYKPRWQESVETVGHAARSVTSTTAAVTTRNERIQKLVHRCAIGTPCNRTACTFAGRAHGTVLRVSIGADTLRALVVSCQRGARSAHRRAGIPRTRGT